MNESTPLNGATTSRPGTAKTLWTRLAIGLAAVVCGAAAIASCRRAFVIDIRDGDDDISMPRARPVLAAAADGVVQELFCGLTGQDAGYISLPNKKDDKYFYWFYESRSQPTEDPLVLWLTGGPGCSSLMAMLTENGPCHVQPDLSTQLNPYSWTNVANMIWLDQPTNVGFSHGTAEDADHNETDVGENIYYFMQGFLDKHPHLRDREFYITGESYGGHYVPAAAHYIWEMNKHNSSTLPKINLQGIAIGNGMTDPVTQWPHTVDMIENAYNVTLVNATTAKAMREAVPECRSKIEACQLNDDACVDSFMFCALNLLLPLQQAGRNLYDIRMPCDKAMPTQCYNLGHVAKYLDSDNVRQYIGVDAATPPTGKWQECNLQVNVDFTLAGDPVKGFANWVADLLNDDIRVLVYAGDADLMCNWIGNDAWTRALEWKGQGAFNAAEEHEFVTTANVHAGIVRSSPLFTFFRVFNAGHMVPQDQPAVALEMITNFLRNKPF